MKLTRHRCYCCHRYVKKMIIIHVNCKRKKKNHNRNHPNNETYQHSAVVQRGCGSAHEPYCHPPRLASPHATAVPSFLRATQARPPHEISATLVKSAEDASPPKFPANKLASPHATAVPSFLRATQANPPHEISATLVKSTEDASPPEIGRAHV
jgi:hypothetical protein